MKRWRIACGLAVSISFFTSSTAAREWEDNTGKKIEAEFIRMTAGWVELGVVSNRVVRVPFRNLSPADQTHVRQLAADQAASALAAQLEGMVPTDSAGELAEPEGAAEADRIAAGERPPASNVAAHRATEVNTNTEARSKKEIQQVLKVIMQGASRGPESAQATAVLNAYRYLCGLAWDVQTDPELEDVSLAGAKLCEAIGHLEHTPANPGWLEDDYKKGYRGTSQGNLFSGGGGAVASVHAYMNDSGGTNLQALGHRRWCLNPPMQRTGFGTSGSYSCMHAFDGNRKKVPEWEMVAYPAPGFFPSSYFGNMHAWSVTLNPEEFKAPEVLEEGQVRVCRVFDSGKLGKPMELVYAGVDRAGYGVANCIIFLPRDVDLGNGECYRVEIGQIKKKSGKTITLAYEVEFMRD